MASWKEFVKTSKDPFPRFEDLRKADLDALSERFDGRSDAYKPYGNVLYAGAFTPDSEYASEWHYWTVTEMYMVGSYITSFYVNMEDVYVIDSTAEYLKAVRIANTHSDLYRGVLYLDVARLLKRTGKKALYYTSNIAYCLHIVPDKSRLVPWSDEPDMVASDLRMLDVDQILIVDPSCILRDSILDITDDYRGLGVLADEILPSNLDLEYETL